MKNALNSIRIILCLILLLMGSSAVYGRTATGYGKTIITAQPSEYGGVHLNTEGEGSNAYAGTSWKAEDSREWQGTGDVTFYGSWKTPVLKDFYANAKANNGYYFKGWSTNSSASSGSGNALAYKFTAKVSEWGQGQSTGMRQKTQYYALFDVIKVTGVEPTSFDFKPTALYQKTEAKEISFLVTGKDLDEADFTLAITDKTDGTWNIVANSWTVTAVNAATNSYKVTVQVTYSADRKTYKNKDGKLTDTAKITLTSKGDSSSATCELSATFAMTVGAPSPASSTLTIEYPATSATGETTFPVQYIDALTDLDIVFTPTSEDETWSTTTTFANNQVTVKYTCTVGENSTRGTKNATITLTAKSDATKTATGAVSAAIKATMQDAGSSELIRTTPDVTKVEGYVATFATAYASSTADFVLPTSVTNANGTWTFGTAAYTSGTFPLGTLTIPYTFEHDGTPDEYAATFTVKTVDETTAVSHTLQAIVEAASDVDAEVITAGGVTTQYEYWKDALAAANTADGNTLRLLRDVELGTLTANQEIKTTMTLDLNGKILSATLPSKTYPRLLYLNTADKTLTIRDSKKGGTIRSTSAYNGAGYAVQISKGNLILESGTIEATFTNTTNSDHIMAAVYILKGTSFTMHGGTLTATHAVGNAAEGLFAAEGTTSTIHAGTIQATAKTYAYGICAKSSAAAPSEVMIENPIIEATAIERAYGVCSHGKVNVSGGTIKAQTAEVNGSDGKNYAFGIYMDVSHDADAALCYYGQLKMTGGTIEATAAIGYAYGVHLNASDGIVSTNATDGTHTNKSSAVATIENATIKATTSTSSYARGVLAKGCYNSLDNTTTPTVLKNVTIYTSSATTHSEGVYADAAVSNTTGNKRWAELQLTDCNITSETTGGTTARAVYVHTAAAVNASSSTWPYEENAVASSVAITRGTYTAIAKTSSAYGVHVATRALSTGGVAVAYPKVTIEGGTFYAETGTSTAFGIYTGGHTTITDGSIFTAITASNSTTACGAYIPSGTFTATDATFTATAGTSTARAIWAEARIESYALIAENPVLTLTDVTATATTTTKNGYYAYGVHLSGVHKTQTQANYDALKDADKTAYGDTYVVGERAAMPTATIIRGKYTATAYGAYAYGIMAQETRYSSTGSTGKASAGGDMIVRGAIVSATTQTNTQAYGIHTSGPSEIDNCQITAVSATSSNARGVSIYDNKTKLTNSTITSTAQNTAYGVYVYSTISDAAGVAGWTIVGELESENNTIRVNTTTGNSAFGLELIAKQLTTTKLPATGEYYAPLGQFAVAASATSTNDVYTVSTGGNSAYGIRTATRVITNGGKAEAYPKFVLTKPKKIEVTAGTSSAYGIQSGGHTVIDDAVFTVKAGTVIAYGAYAPSGTFKATNTTFDVTAEGVSSATNTTANAYGIYGDAAVDATTMHTRACAFELNTVTAKATATTGTYAYGVYMKGATKTQTQAQYDAYTGDKAIYYVGEKSIFPKVTINGGQYIADAYVTTARGIYMDATQVSATGKASAGGELTVKNATIEATTQTGSTADGIRASGPTEIDNCKITAKAATTTVNGIYIYDNHTKLTNSTITAEGKHTDATKAANVYGIYVNASLLWNKTLLSGWEYVGTLESENNKVTATVTNGMTAYGLWLNAHAATSTFPDATPNPEDYYKPTGDYACAASATLKNDTYTATAAGKTAYAVGFQAEQVKNESAAAPTCTIHSGKFWGEAPEAFADIHPNGLKDNVVIEDGYFRNKDNVDKHVVEGKTLLDLPSETPEYGEGYRYFLGQAKAPGVGVCEIGSTQYKTLEEALQVVKSGEMIRMLNSYTLPKGNYVLPANTTLLIPYHAGQTTAKATAPDRTYEAFVTPSAYLTLTFAEGVNFTQQGVIEVGGKMQAAGALGHSGAVTGPYGHLRLEKNARVDVESGAVLYAWGYVTGDGQINVKKGAKSYEGFQIGDWLGGSAANAMNQYSNKQKGVFLITHYFYQNIESTIIYRAGAQAYGASAVYANDDLIPVDNVMLVGEKRSETDKDVALFLMDKADNGENVWISKTYDPATDRTHWVLNSNTTLSKIEIQIEVTLLFRPQTLTFNSADYILPLSSNMTITLNSGVLDLEENVYMMPGVSLNIAKEATLLIPTGNSLYMIDKAQWEPYYGTTYIYTPAYSPNWSNSKNSPRNDMIKDNTDLPTAEIFVHGAIEVHGNLFTTVGGANIHSTNADAGKVFFASDWSKQTATFYQLVKNEGSGLDVTLIYSNNNSGYSVTSAKLKNEVGELYTETATLGAAGKSFNYINGAWKSLTEGCLSTEDVGGKTHYYANPSDIVEVNGGNTEPGYEYTYSNISGEKRYFINTAGKTADGSCMWWEVKRDENGEWYASDERFPSTYGGYYEYNAEVNYWTPVTVEVKWLDEDGMTELATYNHHKGLSPVYLEETPTKAGSAWVGWTSDGGVTVYDRNATLPPAKEAITYTAVFEENIIKHTVVFKDMNGGVIEAGLWAAGATPSCGVTPENILTTDKVYTFRDWSPAITSVTGPTEYRAQYTAAARPYTIHFMNYDGKELYKEDFAYGTTPVYHGATPTRESNWAYSYVYEEEWVSSTGASGFATVTGEEWYTAQFTAIEREYGDWFDVVNAESGILVLNLNGYTTASGSKDWVITVVNEADATKNGEYRSNNREKNRTLKVTIPIATADSKVLIMAKDETGKVESRRRYIVPHVYTGAATLGKVAEDYSSIVYVKSGTLTVTKDATLAAIYVAPGAELKINSGVTLAVSKLVLRTDETAAAILTDEGKLLCKNVNYSHVVNKKGYFPIALPFEVNLDNVTFSYGAKAILGKHFALSYYNADRRANEGSSSLNWQVLPAGTTTMNAQQAYYFYAPTSTYQEYYFPVEEYKEDAEDATVDVRAYEGSAGSGNWGWNAIASPYTSRYPTAAESPEEAVKISMLNEKGTYDQLSTIEDIDHITPATLFFYQAPGDGHLLFGKDAFSFVPKAVPQSIMARRTPANISPAQTQWIRLAYSNEAGQADKANIYLHPDKFSASYDLGYDVQKLSTSGSSPFVWTSAAYGDLAFAALPDTLAAQGIALSMHTPVAGEMSLSLLDNQWMSRLSALYLMDMQENTQVDLLQDDYTWLAEAGTCTGRFVLYPILRAPSDDNTVTTLPSQSKAISMVAYGVMRYIIVENVSVGADVRCYDITGKLVTSCTAMAEQVRLAVPTSGMYFIHADNQVQKVMVNK